MSYFSVILPAAKTNLMTNPSFELGTTNWVASGAGVSIARVATKQRRGAYSCEVTTATGVDSAVYFTSNLTSGTTYTFSVDVLDVAGQVFRMYFYSGGLKGTYTIWTGTGAWSRHSVTITADVTAAHSVIVRRDATASTAKYYIDGALFETGEQTTYFDGDTLDCKWTGAAHASTSSRPASSRAGGTVTDLQDLGFYTSEVQGLGMAGIEPHIQNIGSLPGALFTGSKVLERDFTLIGEVVGSSHTDLHSKRKALIDALKNDRVKDKQAVTLIYSGANSGKPLRIKARYTGGLAAGRQVGFTERAALKFVATDPYWYEDGDEGAALTVIQTIASANYAVKRVDGVWSNISASLNGAVYAIAKLPNGNYVLGGSFTNVGDANGDYIVQYNPTTGAFTSMGTGMNGAVNVLAVAPNGDVYAGGNFTLAGGVAGTARIAKWNGTAWVALGTGIASGAVYAIAIGNDGKVYIGGSFTDHFDANGDYITSWDGTTYASLGTGMNALVRDLVIDKSGDLVAVGNFSAAGGVAAKMIARWDVDNAAWYAYGDGTAGLTFYGYAAVVMQNGDIIFGGDFTVLGGVTTKNIIRWDGSRLVPLGSGLEYAASGFVVDKDNNLIAFGSFTKIGDLISAKYIALWNGSSWANLGISPPAPVSSGALYGDDLYIGYGTAGTAYSSYLNTITNSGTAAVYPKITFKRSGGTSATAAYLKNETTGATIWLNYALQDGETLTLDFSLTNREVISDYRGSVIGSALLRNSDFTDFFLLPGENKISAYVLGVGSPTVTSTINYPLTHWSHDGSAA